MHLCITNGHSFTVYLKVQSFIHLNRRECKIIEKVDDE